MADKKSAEELTLENLPTPDFLDLDKEVGTGDKSEGKMKKHAEAYEEFCKWSATPRELREVKTHSEFERAWNLPKNYCSRYFKNREDYLEKTLDYFKEWMIDKFPDVMYSVYERAMRKHAGSTRDAKIFINMIESWMEEVKPKKERKVQPFLLVGVSQDKLNELFVPNSYDEVVDKTLEVKKKKMEKEDFEEADIERA